MCDLDGCRTYVVQRDGERVLSEDGKIYCCKEHMDADHCSKEQHVDTDNRKEDQQCGVL